MSSGRGASTSLKWASSLQVPPASDPHRACTRLRRHVKSLSTPAFRSPYTLLQDYDLSERFAPLEREGWMHGFQKDETGARRFTRIYDFRSKEWVNLLSFFAQVGQIVQEENHHPVIHICPVSDYNPPSAFLKDQASSLTKHGFIFELSTITHTPITVSADGRKTKAPPGVTWKDLCLAERIEKAFQDIKETHKDDRKE